MKKTAVILLLAVHISPLCAQHPFRPLPENRTIPVLVDPECRMLYESPKDTLSVFIIGDIMMHSPQFAYDHTEFLSRIESRMKASDICIVNMEFTTAGKPYTGYPCFSAPDSYAWDMAEKGVDVFLMANNHILDKGTRGLERTLSIYDEIRDSLGVLHTGTDWQTLTLVRKGISLSLVNFTYGTNNPTEGQVKVNRMDREGLQAMFGSVPEENDFVITLPHWGEEYKLIHNKRQEEWAGWLVEQGSDVIVGAHPHVPQDTSHVAGVPVIYSMGNAVSNMSHPNTQLELAVTLRFASDRVSGEKKMLEPQIDFMWCSRPGGFCDNYCVIFVDEWLGQRDKWLRPSDYDNMVATLERVCTSTGTGARE